MLKSFRPFLPVVALALAPVLWADDSKSPSGPAVTDTGDRADFKPRENYRDRDEFIRDFLTANGGRSYLDTVTSVRMIGTYTEGENKLDITTFRKRPNLVRTNFQSNEYKLSLGYDGGAVWQSLERSGLVTSGQMGGSDADEIKRHSYFLHPFYNLRETSKSLTLFGKEKFSGRDCWRVDMKGEESLVKFYHSCETLNEIGSSTMLKVEGKEVLIEVRKEDYRLVDRMLLPHQITTFRDGKISGVYQFSNIVLNHGIQDSYFRKPTPRFNR